MPNTRFIRAASNWVVRTSAAATTPRIINGDAVNFPTGPALVQDPAYPADHLVVTHDRYTVYATGDAPGGTVTLEIDLGQGRAVQYIGIHGIRRVPGFPFPSNCTVNSLAAGTYAAYPTGWSARAVVQLGTARDAGALITSVTQRYWRFDFNAVSSPFSIGAIVLAGTITDLGILYAPGMRDTRIVPAISTRSAGGHLAVARVGDTRRLITMPLTRVDDTIRNAVDSVFSETAIGLPTVWIDGADAPRQVMLTDSQLEWAHEWATPNLWSGALNLEVLG